MKGDTKLLGFVSPFSLSVFEMVALMLLRRWKACCE